MTVADVTEEQLPRILEIERQCFSVPWTEAMLRSQLAPGHAFLAAVEHSGGNSASPLRGDAELPVLGYVGLMYVLDEGYISNVAVAPEARRRGVADALISALESRARELGLVFLTLEVREHNAPAIALYEKHGFRTVGRRKNYYEKPVEDAILMTLQL